MLICDGLVYSNAVVYVVSCLYGRKKKKRFVNLIAKIRFVSLVATIWKPNFNYGSAILMFPALGPVSY